MGVMSYEETPDVSCMAVTPACSKGALGTWRSQCSARTLSRDHAALEAGTSSLVNRRGRGVCRSVLKLRRESGKTHEGKPRSEPDWGNPTVRDRRGACGIVVSMGAGLRPRAIASRDLHSKHSSPIVFIESGLEPLVLYADLGGFVSAQ